MNKYEMALKLYDTPYGFLSWERQGIVLMRVEKEEMEQQKRELPADATLADMMGVCDGLAAQGYLVHIEYKNKNKAITVYGSKTNIEIEKLKEKYATLALHPPAPQGKKWDDYQLLMQGLERQLLEAGVEV